MRRLAAIALVVCMTAAWPAGAGAGTPPPSAAEDDRVIYEVLGEPDEDGSNVDAYTVRPDGSDLVRWTADGDYKSPVVASPDGTRTAYVGRGGKFGPSGLLVDGRAIGVAADQSAPEWSPDGTQVAVTRGRDVLVVDPDRGSSRVVFHEPRDDTYSTLLSVRWSPDGALLAVGTNVLWDETATDNDLWLVPLDGRTPWRSEVSLPQHSVPSPSWAPDGSRLVVPDAGGQLVVLDRDGTAIADLALTGRDPAWSPRGDAIAYVREHELRLVAPDGTGDRLLFSAGAPVRSPDGERLLRSTQLSTPTWSGDAQHLAWSSSTTEAIEGTNQLETRLDVHVVAAAGGTATTLPNPAGWASHPGWVNATFRSTTRAAGADRVATAVAVSRRAFAEATTVVVARSDVYADALAAAPVAGTGSPVLLTGRDALDPRVAAEIDRLGADRAVVMGTEDAVSSSVEAALRAQGVTVERIGGPDRFATAAAAAAAVAPEAGITRAFVVRGLHPDPSRGWEDAVAVGALAAATDAPILLTTADALPAATAQALRGVEEVTIVGGTAAVSAAVEAQIADLVPDVDRLAGPDRYATSAAVADAAVAAGLDAPTVWAVSAGAWPDAVTAAPAAAAGRATVLLVHPGALDGGPATARWLAARPSITSATVVGGRSALAPAVGDGLRALLDPR